MDTQGADENLRVIRKLLERTTIYRRSLAPVLLATGLLGLLAGVGGWFLQPATPLGFGSYWNVWAVALVLLDLLLVYRQAGRGEEEMWSAPARRVVRSVLPSFVCGLLLGLACMASGQPLDHACWAMVVLWHVFYGCGLQTASFFMPRELRFCGWSFIALGLLWVGVFLILETLPVARWAHLVIGASFGGLNLGFGVWLAFTEKRRAAV